MRPALAVVLSIAMSAPIAGQWLTHRDPTIPRAPDGKPNLAAPVPRASDGRSDLSGVWQVEATPSAEMVRLFSAVAALSVPGDDVLTFSKYFLNLLADFSPETSPMRAETVELFRRLSENRGAESPTANCLPPGITQADLGAAPHKIVQTPRLVVMMYEAFGGHRQIYLDGRPLPSDPEPLWLGYSVGHWEGETLVVDSGGFNDKTRLDALGHPHSEALHVVERFRRRDFGHMDVTLTVEDSIMYSKPFTVTFVDRLIPDSDVGEYYCVENEKDKVHIPRK